MIVVLLLLISIHINFFFLNFSPFAMNSTYNTGLSPLLSHLSPSSSPTFHHVHWQLATERHRRVCVNSRSRAGRTFLPALDGQTPRQDEHTEQPIRGGLCCRRQYRARRKQPSLESDKRVVGRAGVAAFSSKARSDGGALGGENSRRVASRRRKEIVTNVPTDDLGRFDHYMRVGLPSQFFYHYNRLLR